MWRVVPRIIIKKKRVAASSSTRFVVYLHSSGADAVYGSKYIKTIRIINGYQYRRGGGYYGKRAMNKVTHPAMEQVGV